MKRLIAVAAAVCLMACSLISCGHAQEKDPEPTQKPTAELTEFEQWQQRMLGICNMDYDGFADYWDLMCDRYYGDELLTVLDILSGGAKPFLPLSDRDALIETTRASYAERYGEDWRFDIADIASEDLGELAREDLGAELNKLADGIDVLLSAADGWNDAGWAEFALDHGCSVDDAKRLVEAYKNIAALCRAAEVGEAMTVSVTLRLTGENTSPLTKQESFTVYLVNGHYITEPIIDYTYALINLVF